MSSRTRKNLFQLFITTRCEKARKVYGQQLFQGIKEKQPSRQTTA